MLSDRALMNKTEHRDKVWVRGRVYPSKSRGGGNNEKMASHSSLLPASVPIARFCQKFGVAEDSEGKPRVCGALVSVPGHSNQQQGHLCD